MHTGKGRREPLHVDYIFLGACLAFIQDSIFEAVLSHPRLDLKHKIALVKALGKVIWIQNDLHAKWHTTDGLEYRDEEAEAEIDQAAEPEGYLNGKKILGNSSGSDDSSSMHTSHTSHTSSSSSSGKTSLGRPIEDATHLASRCPFTGLTSFERDEQRAMATRSPRLDPGNDFMSSQFHKPGTPRVRIVDGKPVIKGNLDEMPFER